MSDTQVKTHLNSLPHVRPRNRRRDWYSYEQTQQRQEEYLARLAEFEALREKIGQPAAREQMGITDSLINYWRRLRRNQGKSKK